MSTSFATPFSDVHLLTVLAETRSFAQAAERLGISLFGEHEDRGIGTFGGSAFSQAIHPTGRFDGGRTATGSRCGACIRANYDELSRGA